MRMRMMMYQNFRLVAVMVMMVVVAKMKDDE